MAEAVAAEVGQGHEETPLAEKHRRGGQREDRVAEDAHVGQDVLARGFAGRQARLDEQIRDDQQDQVNQRHHAGRPRPADLRQQRLQNQREHDAAHGPAHGSQARHLASLAQEEVAQRGNGGREDQ